MSGDAPYRVVEADGSHTYANVQIAACALLALWSLFRLYVMARSA